MNLQDLSSKDRALLTLKVLLENRDGKPIMVARSYVVEKINACIGNPFPEQMLDTINQRIFDKLVEEVG